MEPWDQLLADLDAISEASRMERARCLAVVMREIQMGKERSLPDTSAAMQILRRIASGIESG